jgi:hypothetical protein
MDLKPRTPAETYGPALLKAQKAFRHMDPDEAAARSGVSYHALGPGNAHFCVHFFGILYRVQWPVGTIERDAEPARADIATRILLLHYLLTADGTPPAGKWISFRNLPGGLGYDTAFQGRANLRLAQAFGTDRASFVIAAHSLGGERLSFGDASFLFRVLPRVWLAVVLHLADEEFPASANILFDASASHHLPTEDLAVLGGLLAGRLIRAAAVS